MKLSARKAHVLAALNKFKHAILCREEHPVFATNGPKSALVCFKCNRSVELPTDEPPEKWQEAVREALRR